MVDSPAAKILMLLLSLAGWVLVPFMPVSEVIPESEFSIQIRLNEPSLSAIEFERQVTSQIEGRLSMLETCTRIRSETQPGGALISMEFEASADQQRAERMVRKTIRTLIPDLPPDLSYPDIQVGGMVEMPAMVIALQDPPPEEIDRFMAVCYQIHRDHPAIREITFPDLCDTIHVVSVSEMTVTTQQELTAISNSLRETAYQEKLGTTGWIWTTGNTPHFSVSNLIESVVWQETGRREKISLLETCSEKRWENGGRLFRVEWRLNAGQITSETARDLDRFYSSLKKRFPSAYLMEYRLAETLQNHRRVLLQCLIALILLAGLIAFQMSRRQAGHLLSMLFHAVGICLLGMYLCMIPLSDQALGGITVGLGLGADQGIMILSGRGNKSYLKLALTGSVITTVVPILVLMNVPIAVSSEIQQILFPISMVILGTIPGSISLLRQLQVPKQSDSAILSGVFSRVARIHSLLRVPLILFLVWLIGIPMPEKPWELPKSWLERFPLLESALLDVHFREDVYPSIREHVGGMLIPAFDQLENDYLPDLSSSGRIRLAGKSTYLPLDESLCEIGQQLESELRSQASERYKVGLRCDLPKEIELLITPIGTGSKPIAGNLFRYLVKRLRSFSGINWSLSGNGKSWTTYSEKPEAWTITLEGPDLGQLQLWAAQMMKKMTDTPGVNNVGAFRTDQTREEWTGKIKPESIGRTRETRNFLNLFQTEMTPDLSFHSPLFGKISLAYRAPDMVDIQTLVSLPMPETKRRLSDVLIPVSSSSVNRIERVNQLYQIPISWEYHGSLRLAKRYRENLMRELNQEAPAGCIAFPSGLKIQTIDPRLKIPLYLILLIIWIWLMIAILFESLRYPFLVILAIPLSWIGPMAAILYWKLGMDAGILAGIFLVTGISVNHMIFLLAPLRVTTKPDLQSLGRMYQRKWTSIWMSVVSSSLTFGPFLLLSEPGSFWFSLGIVTITGLFSGVGLSLLVLPFFFPGRS